MKNALNVKSKKNAHGVSTISSTRDRMLWVCYIHVHTTPKNQYQTCIHDQLQPITTHSKKEKNRSSEWLKWPNIKKVFNYFFQCIKHLTSYNPS